MSPSLYLIVVPLIRTERAANVQPAFVLQHFHAAPANRGVHMFIDPGPWHGRHLRPIDGAGIPVGDAKAPQYSEIVLGATGKATILKPSYEANQSTTKASLRFWDPKGGTDHRRAAQSVD